MGGGEADGVVEADLVFEDEAECVKAVGSGAAGIVEAEGVCCFGWNRPQADRGRIAFPEHNHMARFAEGFVSVAADVYRAVRRH